MIVDNEPLCDMCKFFIDELGYEYIMHVVKHDLVFCLPCAKKYLYHTYDDGGTYSLYGIHSECLDLQKHEVQKQLNVWEMEKT